MHLNNLQIAYNTKWNANVMQIVDILCCLGNNDNTNVCTHSVQMQFFPEYFEQWLVEFTNAELMDTERQLYFKTKRKARKGGL
jgi:hypothetical protein